jgi:hypothetical protein
MKTSGPGAESSEAPMKQPSELYRLSITLACMRTSYSAMTLFRFRSLYAFVIMHLCSNRSNNELSAFRRRSAATDTALISAVK